MSNLRANFMLALPRVLALTAGTALLAACTSLHTAPAPPEPNWSPQTADLLFTSGRDGNSEIYLRRAGEEEWTNLTRHEAADNWPVWSPDGERIVFQSRRQGNLDVWVMAADGSNPVQLTDDPEPDYLPAWSPDGTRIVFTSWRKKTPDETRAPHLYLMNADGSNQRRLVETTLETSAGATWSPDGLRIVYSRGAGEDTANVFAADADGMNERRLTDDRGLYNGTPVFSPDGTRIAFYSADGTASALVVLQADGRGRRTVLSGGQSWYPRWSPDGRWLVYTAAVDGSDDDLDLFAVAVEGAAEPILLVAAPGREAEGSWRPRR